jgi:uncharacterized membrane protein YccF (DUF307 family)
VKTVLNILWLLLAGVWLPLGYVFAAVLLAITIIGIPFAARSLKLAGLRALAVRTLAREEPDAAQGDQRGRQRALVRARWLVARPRAPNRSGAPFA